jgi:hypothetical protein
MICSADEMCNWARGARSAVNVDCRDWDVHIDVCDLQQVRMLSDLGKVHACCYLGSHVDRQQRHPPQG